MPKKKIANQPGYELKKNPETGVRRWHAVTKKRINPETGEVFEEPALFEELPDPEPEDFWASVAYLKHRGIEFHSDGQQMTIDLPEPEDVRGEFDPKKFAETFLHSVSQGNVKIPADFGEWVDEAGILDSDLAGMEVDEEVVERLISEAVERGDPGIGGFVATLVDDEDEVAKKIKEMFLNHKFDFLEDYGSGVEALDKLLNSAYEAFDGISSLDEIEDELLNSPTNNIVMNEGYNDRVYEFKATRNKAADELVKVLGARDFDDAIESLKSDPNAIHKWGERLVEELDPDSWYADELREPYADSIHDILAEHENWVESDDPLYQKKAQALQEKYAEFIKGIHTDPALSTNRLPGTTADMIQNHGEYMWREAGGADDDRIQREEMYGIGRVGYAALAYDDAAPVLDKADMMVRLDPNTLALGTGGWGDVRLLWRPPELVDPDGEGLSWAFDDFYYDPEFGDDMNRPFWLSAALGGFSHSARNLIGYPDELSSFGRGRLLPNFTEMHFKRPLKVDGDLSKIYLPVSASTESVSGRRKQPDELAKNLVYDGFVHDMWGSLLVKEVPLDVDLVLQPQTLGEEFGKDYVYDVVGKTEELLDKEFGDKVKLWLPRELKT